MIKIEKYIRDIKDFPVKGIVFKDIAPLLANPEAFQQVVDQMAEMAKGADVIVSPDARGFLFGVPVALKNKVPFVMIRKPGKLPGDITSQSFDLEYGQNSLEVQNDVLKGFKRAVIIDDVLATGGTTEAIVKLMKKQGTPIEKVIFLLSLEFLNGQAKYNIPTEAIVKVK